MPNSKSEYEKLTQRFDAAWAEQQVHYERWDDCFELVVPERSKRYRQNPGADIAPYIYDTTAMEKAENLANQMVSALTPAGIPWMQLVPGAAIVDQEQRLQYHQLLEPVNQILSYHLHMSKFSLAVQPAFLDMMVTAGAIKVEPDTDAKTIRCEVVPINELAYMCSREGAIDKIYRKYMVQAYVLLDKFYDKIPEQKRKSMVDAPLEMHEVRMSLEPAGQKFQYYEILPGFEEPIYLVEKILDRNPFVIWRWSTTSSSVYGRGPALVKYFDILNLNTLSEYQLKAAAFDLLGVWGMEDDGVLNEYTINLVPGAKIPMSSVSMSNPSMRRIDETTGTRYRIGQDTLEGLREVITKAFFADKFSPIEGDKMSATEILQRAQDLAQTLGAVWGRLEAELLRPVAQMYLGILKDIGAFAQLGPEVVQLLNVDRRELDVRFLGTLAQAQQMQNVQGLFQYLAMQQQASMQDPEVAMLVDMVTAMQVAAESMGLPPKMIRTKTQREEIYAKMQEQMTKSQAMNPQMMQGQQP